MKLGKNGDSLAFSLKSRTEDVAMTNPEELIGAAHAGCFSMALTSLIEESGKNPGAIETSAKVTLEQKSDGFWISEVHLITRGLKQEMNNEEFVKLAEKAKQTCPVSKLYSSAVITLDAALA
jgi:osmotically inducible protein OsmC